MNSEIYTENITKQSQNETDINKIKSAKILISGSGGLAALVASSLAKVGIGNICLVNKDIEKITKFRRQYLCTTANINKNVNISPQKWINAFNKNTNIKTIDKNISDIDINQVSKYDIIVDCCDDFESKFVLNKISQKTQKPMIHAAVTEFSGHLTTIIPSKTACLNCLFSPNSSFSYQPKDIISPAIATIAELQTEEVIKLILNKEGILLNKLLTYYSLSTDFKTISITKNKNCQVCSKS